MQARYWRLWVVTGAALLSACGGGGGGAGIAAVGSGTSSAGTGGNSSGSGNGGSTTGITGPTVALSGTASYDSVPNDSGALSYAAMVSRPVRGASVEIVDASANVVATATTDANGAYSASVPADTTLFVRVKAQMSQGGSGPSWDVTVRDNTQSNAIYAMETASFSSGSAALTRDVHAPSGWNGSSYASTRVAAPFALLDTVYAAQAKLLSVAPNAVLPSLRIFWSVNNVPADGNPALGQIGTTSFSNLGDGRAIYVLGKADVDTDEYDSPVVAHEWGHYYQSVFSRDDSPGGDHAMNDRLDRRVAFSEGWGDAWSGIALGRSTYTDSVGPSQAQGSEVDLSAGASGNPGWFNESSIQSVLWRLNAQVGFQPIHAAMSSAVFKDGVPVTSIHPFAAAFAGVAPGSAAALNSLLVGRQISAAPNDPYGLSETNDGGIAGAASTLPMYRSAVAGGTSSACVSNLAGGGNKLGSYVYLKFNLPGAGSHRIQVSGPAGSDPDFSVYHDGQFALFNGYGTSESGTLDLPAGDSVLAVTDYNDSLAATCFSVTIQ